MIHSENGIIGMGPRPKVSGEDPDMINAGGSSITAMKGASYVDSATSFAIIRGGHLSMTVLGALQVDQEGSIANWMIMDRGWAEANNAVTPAKDAETFATLNANGTGPFKLETREPDVRTELERTLKLLGCPSVHDLDASYLGPPAGWPAAPPERAAAAAR